VNPVPRPQPEPGSSGSSESKTSAVRSEASYHRPRVTRQDAESIVRKLQYDLDSARVKLTELRAYIAALDLPSETEPFSETRGFSFVRNTAHEYTDSSIADELALMGADATFVDRALIYAAELRRRQEALT
jgi:hypothetical protein